MDNNLKTKTIFMNSFKELVKKMPADKIKITDLTRDANLSRQTFYRYFKDIDDLIYYIHINNVYLSHDLAEQIGFSINSLENYLELMKKNENFYKSIISFYPNNIFVNTYLKRTKENIIKRFFSNTISEINQDEALKFSLDFFNYGFSYSILDWIKNGCELSPTLLANLLYNSIPENLKEYISKSSREN